MVKQARKLVKEKGILELPGPKKGKVLSEETKRCVVDFYFVMMSTADLCQAKRIVLALQEMFTSRKGCGFVT